MNSPDVAAALYAGAPDAAGKLYDAHAEALFQYCWLTLRDRWQAKTAVCDALVQAGARVAELSDPATLRAWLFALVRAECHHHPLPSLGDTDEPIARPEQPDATLRIMAWNSVMSLDLVQRQALDLATRHGMTEAEIGLILGLPLPGTTELLATARAGLERALGAEILVSRDSLECPGRTEAIRGWTGTVTPEFRDRLLAHAGACEVCRPRLPGNVSPGRIFGLLPAPALDGAARSWVISRVGELIRSQAAEPAPVEVATPEMALLPPVPPEESHEPPVQAPAQAGAPKPKPTPEPEPQPQSKPAAARPAPKPQPRAQPAPAAPRPAPRRRRLAPRILAGVAAALAAAGIAAGLAVGSTGGHTRLSGSDSRLATGPAAPAQAGMGQPDPGPDAPPARPGRGRRSPAAGATTSPAAGGADAVTSGKQAGAGARGGTRAGGQGGQTTRRTVTVAVAPRTQAGGPGAPASTQAAARLTVSPASLVLDQGSSGDLTLTASGGPVSWSAGATSGSVGVSPASGQLGNGDSATVTVTVTRSGANGGSATVSINGAQVSVSWSARPAASAPSGSSGSTGASGSAGSGPGSAGASPPAGRRHHRPNAGGSPAPAGS